VGQRWLAGLALVCLATVAHAETQVLRLATIAPDGTAWARELKAYAREVSDKTAGRVTLKIYYGGIAGDEMQVGERITRGQLDGAISGGALCGKLSPSMRVPMVQGVFQNREEAVHVMSGLNGLFDEELRAAGFTHLGAASIGAVILFTTSPVATLDDIKKLRLGHWDLDQIGLQIDHAIGITSIPLPPDKVNAALESKQLDGIATTPTVVLGFQLMPHLRHYLDLRTNYFYGCVLVANRSFDRVAVEDQGTLRAATAKFRARIEQVGKQQDDELLGGLFAQKGIKPLPVSAALRSEYLVAARQAREQLGDKLGVPAATLQRVLALLADFRAARTN
jgi:TRAP-type transport system periplasmic protein